jgi:hypothetical protein
MDAGFATSTIGTWSPDPLPEPVQTVTPSVDAVRALSTAKTTDTANVANVKHQGGGSSLLTWVVVLLVVTYVGRVTQIRRRKILRRRAQRHARLEATRARVEQRYARPPRAPRTLDLREPEQRSRSGSFW